MNDGTIRVALTFDHGPSFHHVKHTRLPCRPMTGDFFEPSQEDMNFLKKEYNKVYRGDDTMMERWVIKGCEFLGQTFVVKLKSTRVEI